jgi:hypothetical protein
MAAVDKYKELPIRHSLGKGEVHSSILCGSTRNQAFLGMEAVPNGSF